MLQRLQIDNSRGTELLDELALVLPGLYDFDSKMDRECAAAIKLIARYWETARSDMSIGDGGLEAETMRLLNQLYVESSELNIPVACGILIMACHIESSYLTDDAARLVRDITDIHIHRANSIMNRTSIAA